MRLYLSSFDLGDRPDALVGLVAPTKRAAIIVNALDNFADARADWLNAQTTKLAKLGFSVTELDLRPSFGAAGALGALLHEVDAVWINGGNSFILRRAMKQSGFDALIRSALAKDEIVYAGFSAAAVIVSASLKGLEAVDNPTDVPSGYDTAVVWDGLGLLPFSIVVHYKSDHSESVAVEQEVAYYKANHIPYRTLRDGEALVIDGDRQAIVGARGNNPRA